MEEGHRAGARGSEVDRRIARFRARQGQIVAKRRELVRLRGRLLEEQRPLLRQERGATEGVRRPDGQVEAMIDAASICVCALDEEGIFARVSGAYAAMLGYRPAELIGRPFTAVYPLAAPGVGLATFRRALAQAVPSFAERTLRRKDGTPVVVQAAAIPVVAPDGRLQLTFFTLDISARKRAEEAQAHLAALVASTSDAIIGTSLDGTITSWNPGAERLYGYAAAEAIGCPVAMLAIPGGPDAAGPFAILAVLQRGEPVVDLDAVRRRKDGSAVPVSISASLVRDGGGAVVGAVGIHRDMSARKAAEEALAQRERDFRLLAENSADVIARCSPEMRLLYASPAVRQLLGFAPEEVVGRSSIEFVHPEDLPATEWGAASATYRCLRADGSYVWVETVGRAVRDEASGEITEFQVATRDIGARKAAEEALARANAELARANAELAWANAEWETLLRVLPVGVGIADDPAIGRIRMNPAFARMHGLPLGANASLTAPEGERPVGLRVYRGGRELAAELPFEVAAATGREVRDLEVEVVLADGERRRELVSVAPLFDERGRVRGAVGAYLDISARVEAERQRDLLLAGLAHDLKNPLAGLVWLAEILQREGAGPDRVELLDSFVQGARQMMRQVNELVDTARAQLGRPPELELRRVDLAELVARQAAEQSKLHHVSVEGAEEPLVGLCDEARLGRALANVIGNAVKYSAPGGEVTAELSRAEEGTGGWAAIRVADRGIGIPASEVGRVFEPYYRASNARRQAEGSGLGLAGVRQVVEAHGGSVELASEEGVGTTVTIRLPLRPPGLPGAAEETSQAPRQRRRRPAGRPSRG